MTSSFNDSVFRECVEILNSVKPDLDKLHEITMRRTGVIQSTRKLFIFNSICADFQSLSLLLITGKLTKSCNGWDRAFVFEAKVTEVKCGIESLERKMASRFYKFRFWGRKSTEDRLEFCKQAEKIYEAFVQVDNRIKSRMVQ